MDRSQWRRQSVMKTSLGVFLLICVCTDAVGGQTYSMHPTNVSDIAGNSANENSTISWAPIPAGTPLKTKTTDDAEEGGLKALMDMTRQFVALIAPGELPYELISKVMTDVSSALSDIQNQISTLLPLALGIAICFVFGFLFIFIMPIVGCCLCCCRCCCGNCGGKKLQRKHPKDTCKRICFSIALLCIIIMMLVGTLCTYLTNTRISDSVEGTATTISNNLDDLPVFLNNTIEQINYAAKDNFNFTLDVLDRDLDNIGYLVGMPVRTDLATNGGVDAAVNSIIGMESTIIPVSNALFALNNSIANIKAAGNTLQTDLADLKTKINDAKADGGCTGCGAISTANIAMDVDFNNLPDISNEVNTMNSVRSNNLTELAMQGKEEFNKIPERVQNETSSLVQSIKNTLHGIPATIYSALAPLESLPNQVVQPINSFKPQITEYLEYATQYNQYRWYGFMGLTGLLAFIVLMQILGLACGVLGTHKDALPTERGCLSNTGGNCLMAASGFMFIFSSILMLLTSLTFIIGAPMEKLVCEPLKDPTFKIFKELLDKPGSPLDKTGYFLGGVLFNNNTINLTISGVLSGCKQNKAAYEVLMLGNMFDLNTVLDYKQHINFNSQLDTINVDLSSVKILSADTEKQLTDFRSTATTMDFNGFKTELAKSTTQFNLTELITNLNAAKTASSGSAKGKLQTAINKANSIQSGSYPAVDNAKTQLLADVNTLEGAMAPVPTAVNNTIDNAKTVDTYLANNGSALIKEEAKNYAQRMLNTADQFASKTLSALQTEIGTCVPVWNIWFSVVHKILCSYFIGSLNAFWFSLGWCVFFFIPSIIFCIKLARYFRCMKYLEGYDDPSDYPMKDLDQPTNGKPPVFANNKVKPI